MLRKQKLFALARDFIKLVVVCSKKIVQRCPENSVDTESSGSFADANQQVNEAKAEANKHAGVCPLELERRLHELLEARQHERIAELETALECAARKLDEKEVEICWWRDTARLVTKHREQRLQLQF
ncbi:hypothetical protein KSP40_PGU013820 [Platanthera guangdongensis]|uniref:Uncharacterized protein n=1 Tax=Platanthera guangdongensis TaxID=2320717 RepID=A0ABR2LVQ8_9ASPA